MKRKQFLFTSALLIAVTFGSCKKDKNDSNNNGGTGGKDSVTFTVNGGAFANKVITINADPKQPQNGAFVGSSGYLKINFTDTSLKLAVDIAFPHAATGTANVNDPINSNTQFTDKRVYFLLQVQENGNNKILDSDYKHPEQTPGTITVTKCGSAGGIVEGDFQGTLKDAGVTYIITKGHFIASRKS